MNKLSEKEIDVFRVVLVRLLNELNIYKNDDNYSTMLLLWVISQNVDELSKLCSNVLKTHSLNNNENLKEKDGKRYVY